MIVITSTSPLILQLPSASTTSVCDYSFFSSLLHSTRSFTHDPLPACLPVCLSACLCVYLLQYHLPSGAPPPPPGILSLKRPDFCSGFANICGAAEQRSSMQRSPSKCSATEPRGAEGGRGGEGSGAEVNQRTLLWLAPVDEWMNEPFQPAIMTLL